MAKDKMVMTFNIPIRTRKKLEFISGFSGLDFTSVVINAVDAAYGQYRFEKSERDALNAVNVGDRVYAWKSIRGYEYSTTGTVVEMDKTGPMMCIEDCAGRSDWYRVENNGIENFYKILSEEEWERETMSIKSLYLENEQLNKVNAALNDAGYASYPGDRTDAAPNGCGSGYACNLIDHIAGADTDARREVRAIVSRLARKS